ncbi:pseudouridine synthase [Oceanihabitans sp. 2_MG-2023]|uniref:pseudouridine synthase n=1 Tax=Oceanihabitans sp. 2_MG-2023 TaxID=3062661 RepID=UPI0026E1D737|nr:pseudouridine synthase [Oceanihabitans sp. 2_MG-2023]MDO6597228.1 pseudouridine synthase [Oceanihabitans sp. 2_MG-2023]
MQVQENHQHFILHKPYGYLSQLINNQNKRKNKRLLGELFDFPERTMAIGRLDENSEGLLLLTTNGKVSEEIRSAKFEKEYYAQVDGLITTQALKQLQEGVEIGIHGTKYKTKPCIVKNISNVSDFPFANRKVRDARHGPMSWVSITLTEGKFRQVRKMTAAVGFPTLRLVRVRIGSILLKIESGKVEEVADFNN